MISVACEAMRSRFEIVLADANRDAHDLRAAGEEALSEIRETERLLSAYRRDSDLWAINQNAEKNAVVVDARVLAFLQRARELSRQTSGAFDPTVGPLLRVWDVTGDAQSASAPTKEEIEDARQRVGVEQVLELNADAQTARLIVSGARLDPGAMGKGWGLEQAADVLRESGIRSALLHGGTSSVIAIGTPPDDERGWRVALAAPDAPGNPLAHIYLRDNALGVSAPGGKVIQRGGRTWGHVIDPRSGYPVRSARLAATVTPNAADADALSTALLVLGEPGIARLSAAFPQAGFLLVLDVPGSKTPRLVAQNMPLY